MTKPETRPTSSNIYNAWQKVHHLKDKLESFHESLKSHNFKEETESVEISCIHLQAVAESLSKKLLDRSNKKK